MAAESEGYGFFSNPYLWTTLALLIVLYMFYRARIAVFAYLDARSQKIADELDEAQRLREEAHDLLAKYQRKQSDALKEADEIKKNAQEEAQRLLRRAEADLEASLKRREQQAVDRIANLEAQAASEIQAKIAAIATKATEELLREKVTGAKADELVAASAGELKDALH